jgi:hypothetical protein
MALLSFKINEEKANNSYHKLCADLTSRHCTDDALLMSASFDRDRCVYGREVESLSKKDGDVKCGESGKN